MIISRTPFRISFFGGGTDYPEWYRVHGGQVLATTIDKYAYLMCRYLPPFFEHRHSITYSKIEHCHRIDEISHPAVRAVLQHLGFERGIQVNYHGDLPARSGMGSSSTFTVGLLHALYALKGAIVSKAQLAKEGILVEQQILRETVGSQDQVLAAFGGLNHIVFQPSNEVTVRPMTIRAERVRELESHLMLFYTAVKRTASAVAATYVPTIRSKDAELKRTGAMVEEAMAVLAGEADMRAFGELLHEAWEIKRGLSPAVSNPQIEEFYATARAAGAIGGKLLGAGGGGFMLLFVPPGRQDAVRHALGRFIHVPFKFEFSGSQIIFFDPEPEYVTEEEFRANGAIEAFRELLETRGSEA